MGELSILAFVSCGSRIRGRLSRAGDLEVKWTAKPWGRLRAEP